MVRDYVVELYAPAGQASDQLSAADYRGARDLAAWTARVKEAWPQVRVAHVETSGIGDAPELGQQLDVHAVIELGALTREDVRVQVVFGPVDENDQLRDADFVDMTQAAGDPTTQMGGWRYEAAVPLERRGAFGYTVRVLPDHPALASSADLRLVALPAESAV
jgi:starch phosphorylase